MFRKELGGRWRVGEEQSKENENDKGHNANDDHEPLPLCDLGVIRWDCRGGCGSRHCGARTFGVVRAECDEARDDGSETVAHKCPTDTLTHFGTGVEHGVDQHDTGGDASLAESQKKTNRNLKKKKTWLISLRIAWRASDILRAW
jgi:hypothetical protein